MPERTVEEIRKDIAAERQRLADDLDALRYKLRWLVLFPVATAFVRRKGTTTVVRAGLRAMRKLV
jgi:Protein of unknown function (DUF3618)